VFPDYYDCLQKNRKFKVFKVCCWQIFEIRVRGINFRVYWEEGKIVEEKQPEKAAF